jgi:hypothetical protein
MHELLKLMVTCEPRPVSMNYDAFAGSTKERGHTDSHFDKALLQTYSDLCNGVNLCVRAKDFGGVTDID